MNSIFSIRLTLSLLRITGIFLSSLRQDYDPAVRPGNDESGHGLSIRKIQLYVFYKVNKIRIQSTPYILTILMQAVMLFSGI